MEEIEKQNQREKIKSYLMEHKDVTSFEAYAKKDLRITQLATRIKELEEKGYSFNKIWDYNINLQGKKTRFKRYSLDEKTRKKILEERMFEENMCHIPRID